MADPKDESELTQPSIPPEEAPAASISAAQAVADRAQVESHLKATQRALAAQKKVTVRVQEDTYVAVNGYGFLIKGKTKVQVPEQVADLLEEAGRI